MTKKTQSVKKSKSLPKITKSEAIDTLWRKGVLVYKLNSAQRNLYKTFYNTKYRIPVFNLTRRGGKSYTLLVIALEQCLRKSGTKVHYACATAVQAKKIVIPTMQELLKDCPKDLRPKYLKHEKTFVFSNGSKLQIEGADDGNADKLRGSSTDLGIVDEAGFIKELEYLVNDILLPQIMTTNGRLLLSSTPPTTPSHPFVRVFIEQAKLHKAYCSMTIMDVLEAIKDDPPHLQHLNSEIVEELRLGYAGGDTNPTWRREYMVEIITDTTYAVVPEFNEQAEKEMVKETSIPSYYDAYTSMDPGLVDNTGVLFAYLDFQNAQLVIEDEYLANGNEVTSENIAQVIRDKEKILWNFEGETKPVYMRISDNEPILLNDLAQLHNLTFIPARKDDKEAAINDLRMKVASRKIVINPRCKNLIFQLKTALWNKRRTSFERTKEGGHYDLIDALIYMVRSVQWYKNPYPNKGINPDTQWSSTRNSKVLSQNASTVKSIFKKKK